MSEDPKTPEAAGAVHPPNGGGGGHPPNGGGGGPKPPPTSVFAGFATPATALMFVGVPFTVRGSAGSIPPGSVTSVSLSLDGATITPDGAPITVVSDAADWGSWHAVVTPASSGVHTFAVQASSSTLGKSGSATLQLTAVQLLGFASPTPPDGEITTGLLSFTVGVAVAVAVPAFVGAISWQYQLAGGPWESPTAVSQPSSSVWQLTIPLPATAVADYALLIRATAGPITATLGLGKNPPSVLARDLTPPTILGVNAPAEFTAGPPPAVTVQATDRAAGTVFSGIPASGLSALFDGQPCPVAQTVAGDPATWSVTLPQITHAQHSLAVTVTDAALNASSQTLSIPVALQSWTRLEPVPRDPTLLEGLQARVADPLWLLARQAAFGELTGQDSASPVSFRLRARASSLTRVRPSRAAGSASPATGPGELLPSGGPIEMLAEAEAEPATGGATRPLFAAQAGLHYRRLLARAPGVGDLSSYEPGLLAAYPIPPPPSPARPGMPPPPASGDPVLAPYAGRVPDGARLYADLVAALRPPGGGQGSLPARPALGGASAAVVTSVALAWLSWYEAVSGQELGHRDTWIPERAEYAFSIAAPGPGAETVLSAAELDTGELDWLDFDLVASGEVTPASGPVSLGAVPADRPGGDTAIVIAGLPAPVAFRGMPNRRWWDFEDASIDFGSITAPVESPTTSVIVEYAMCYGNDHFLVPVPLDVGSVLRVDSLVVTDTFGEVLLVSPVSGVDTASGPFRLFEHAVPGQAAGTGARDPLFVLFPTAGEVIYGPALEEVHFVRDELAEIVWAIEQTALGPAGLPYDRTADALAHFLPLTPTPNDGTTPPARTYVLRTDVEANWFPFLLSYRQPTAAGDPAPATRLAMADVPPLAALAPSPLLPLPQAPLPWGRILAPFAPVPVTGSTAQPGLLLPVEEVTRAGVQVARAWRYARWVDGRQLSWVGRRVRPGRGPGASGLGFDLTT